MARDVFWETLQEPGFEHLLLRDDAAGLVADGAVLGVFDEPWRAFRMRYRVECDAGVRVRRVSVQVEHPWTRELALQSDGEGRWSEAGGTARPELVGCIDVDVMTTPFTNTLPVRRLAWRRGTTHEIAVAYVTVPSLALSVDRQLYTCLEWADDGPRRFRFASLVSGFTAELVVDRDALVLDYGDVFRRVAHAPAT
jgi:hypothetical protein